MATGSKRRQKAPATPQAVAEAPARSELKLFHDGGGRHENFSFARAYWSGEGERESMASRIDKKMHPVRSASGEVLASAAKVDLLLPPDAPQEYMDIGHVIRRYEETLPAHELNAYVQVTIRFPTAPNLHQPFEMIRGWARSFYQRVPVILILHAPHLWGSANPGHLHCLGLPRRLSVLGWGEIERGIACDTGHRDAYESWKAFEEEWGSGRPG